MKIVTVVGARPQFIKTVPLSRELRNFSGITEVIVHTGQHFDKNMSDIFFSELGIAKPQYNLGISGSSHGAMTGQQLEAIEKILLDERPDIGCLKTRKNFAHFLYPKYFPKAPCLSGQKTISRRSKK